MDEDKKQMWACLSKNKGAIGNNYYFYEDGTILHYYDHAMN